MHALVSFLFLVIAFMAQPSFSASESQTILHLESQTLPQYKVQVEYCRSFDCDDLSLSLCTREGWDHCRQLLSDNHISNILRFKAGDKHHQGTKKYTYCVVEAESGRTPACWSTDDKTWPNPPDAVGCKSYPGNCEDGKYIGELKTYKKKRHAPDGGEDPWWTNPYDNTGALLSICDDLNGHKGDAQEASPLLGKLEDLPDCPSKLGKRCSDPEKDSLACIVSKKSERARCHVLQCQDKQLSYVHWLNVDIPNCAKLDKSMCHRLNWLMSLYPNQREIQKSGIWSDERYCRDFTASHPRGYEVRRFTCDMEGKTSIHKGYAHPGLQRFDRLQEPGTTAPNPGDHSENQSKAKD